jgi:methyl-accepting chemotaxis protein
MKNITIAHRILLMIGASIISLVLVGGAGLYVSSKQAEDVKLIVDNSLNSIQTLEEARQIFMTLQVNAYSHVMSTDAISKESVQRVLKSNAEDLTNRLQKYETMLSGEEDKKLLDDVRSNVKTYTDLFFNDLLPMSNNNENEAAAAMASTQLAMFGFKTQESLNAHIEYNRANADKYTQHAYAISAKGKVASLIVILIGILSIAALGFYTLRNIKSSLNQIQTMVNRVESDLDFTVRVTVNQNDEIGQTTSALNRLLNKLQGNLKSIATGAQSVASAANLMATTSDQVSTASHQQSEAASDMAATVEEMTVSINHVSDRAQEANRISSESGQLAISSERIIGQTVIDIQDIAATVNEAAELIHGLEQHSQQISNVVAVINDVADQTNLLALNAAIEAARAGEQGRGFAVVADEVRKLAERTSVSTKEIGSTIDSMRTRAGNAVSSMQGVVNKVALGVERAQEANDSIKQLGEGSKNAVEMVEEIASAIREQGAATNNIATQVERIAQMSEESSASAGNGAQSAQELDRLAAEMQHIISAYRL